jgi:glycosyltransferase involved in cell wall biosynthesis
MKTPFKALTLLTTGTLKPDREAEACDRSPRASLYEESVDTDLLNEQFLGTAPAWRRFFYRRIPVIPAQCIEAFFLRKRYDVVISWSDPHALLFAAILKFLRVRVPHVALMFWISKPKKARMLRRVHSHIDTIVLWTSAHRDYAINTLGIPAAKIRFIPYYVDQKFWRPMPQASDMICAVGVEMRDYPTFIAAMRGLDIRCHIAAGRARGKLFPTVTAIYEQGPLPANVTAGGLTHLELRELYARSRFVVIPLLPSESDNGLTVILEAMAMGKAVICSRTAGQRDVIIDGVNGIFVPQGDPAALRAAIERLWNDPAEAERMGRAGRAYIEEHTTWEQFIAHVAAFAGEAVANGPRTSERVSGTPARIHATRSSVPS